MGKAEFLTTDEKRAAVGYGPMPEESDAASDLPPPERGRVGEGVPPEGQAFLLARALKALDDEDSERAAALLADLLAKGYPEYRPDQPRVPAGDPSGRGGQWSGGGGLGGSADSSHESFPQHRVRRTIEDDGGDADFTNDIGNDDEWEFILSSDTNSNKPRFRRRVFTISPQELLIDILQWLVDPSPAMSLGREFVANGPYDIRSLRPSDRDYSYETFDQLKQDWKDELPDGYVWHHIVEQNQIRNSGFFPREIHNTENVIRLPNNVHQIISDHYSSVIPESFPDAVRSWLQGKDFEFQK